MFDKRIFTLAPAARKNVAGAVMFQWLGLLAQVAVFVTLAEVLGTLATQAVSAEELPRFMLVCALGVAAYYVCQVLARYQGAKAAAAVKTKVSAALFNKVVALGPAYETAVSTSEISQLMGEGTERLRPYMADYLPQFFFAVLAPLTLFFILLPQSLPVAAVLLVCVPLIPGSIMALMKRAKKFMGHYWGTYVDLGGAFYDAIRGLTTLKVYGADAEKQRQLDQQAEGFRALTMKLLRVQLNNITLMDVFTFGGMAAGMIVALWQLAAGALELTQAFVVVLLAASFFMPMRNFGAQFHTGMNANEVIARIFEILEAPEQKRGGARADLSSPGIECKGLSVSYGEGSQALRNVDFSAGPNDYLGITGPSGSGKSTLVKVLAGALDSYEGSVRVCGAEVRELPREELFSAITVVSHESHVFKGTIRSNLQLAHPLATEAELWQALRKAKLDEFVLAIGGLDAEVFEDGANLSGGQRQRLCFARAVLRNTPIYIFDEAASNVDAASERLLTLAMQELALQKTVMVVSHRFAELRWTDEVLVFGEGRVVQRGAHGALLHQEGLYNELWEQQQAFENFAAQFAPEEPEEELKLTEAQKAMAKMPPMAAQIMQMAMDAQELLKFQNASSGDVPTGHPAWIPLPKLGEEADVADAKENTQERNPGQAEQAEQAERIEESSAATKKPSTLRTFAGLFKLTRGMLPELAAATLLGALGNLAAWLVPACAAAGVLALAANFASSSGGAVDLGPAMPALVLLVVCALARGPLHYGERLLTHSQTFRTLATIRKQLFEKMRTLAPARLEQKGSAELLQLLTADVELLEGFYSRTIAPAAAAVLSALVVLAFLFTQSVLLGAVALVAYVVLGLVVPKVCAVLFRNRGEELRTWAVTMTSFLLDSLRGMADLLQFGRAQEYAAELEEHFATLLRGEGQTARTHALLGALPKAVALACMAVFALAAMHVAAYNMLAPAAAALCLVVFVSSLEPLTAAAELDYSLNATTTSAARILQVLGEQPETPEVQQGTHLEEITSLEFEDVSFAYGATPVLKNVSATLQPGFVLHVTGESGAGKSTLLKLLMRFWDAHSGAVKLSGHNVREITSGSLRAQQSYLTQDTYLFEGTLRENITFVCPQATEEQLQEAIHKAALEEVVQRLPHGLDTQVSGAGANLSSGERQRVGMARVFLHNAPLLILDEPTANLDALNEAAIMYALAAYTEGKTMVLVSHRPAATALADSTLSLKKAT